MIIHSITTNNEDHHFQALAELYLLMVPEMTISLSELKDRFQKTAKTNQQLSNKLGIKGTTFLAYDEDNKRPLGYGFIQLNESNNKLFTSQYSHIFVHPEHRRKGVGTLILKRIMSIASQIDEVKTIFFFAEDEIAVKFLEKNTGEIVEQGKLYELQLNKSSLEKLQSLDLVIDPKITIEIVEQPNENILKDFLEVYNVSDLDAPSGLEQLNKEELLLKSLLDVFQATRDVSIGVFAYYDNKPAGISHIRLVSHVDNLCYQRHTGVHPKYRKQKIATAMKVKLLSWLYTTYPKRTIIRTEVLDENVGMIKVNEKVGFKSIQLQVTVEFRFNEK